MWLSRQCGRECGRTTATCSSAGVARAIDVAVTFTALNWSTAQTVTVSAAADDDKADDTATVTHTVDDSQSDER